MKTKPSTSAAVSGFRIPVAACTALLAVLVFAAPPTAPAANLTWTANGATFGGTGIWSVGTGNNWTLNTLGNATIWADGNTATFNATSSVTLGGNVSATGLTVAAGTTNLFGSGANVIDFGAGGVVSSGSNGFFSSALLMGNVTFTPTTGNLSNASAIFIKANNTGLTSVTLNGTNANTNMIVDDSGALGTTALKLQQGILNLGALRTETIAGLVGSGGNLTFSITTDLAGGTIRSRAGNNTWTGATSLSANSTLMARGAADVSLTFTNTATINLNANTLGIASDVGAQGIFLNGDISGAGGKIATSTFNGGGSNNPTGLIVLSGNNTYDGGTTVDRGILTFLNTNAKPVSGNTTVASGATLALGVADAGSYFTSTDITSLFVGNMTNVSNNATSNVGIDTSAGNFTLSTGIAASTRGLVKLGANTLTLTAANAYTGATTVKAGSLVLSGAGSISNATLTMSGGGIDLGGQSINVPTVLVSGAPATGDTIANGNLTTSGVAANSYSATNTLGTAVISANLLANGAAGFTKTGAGGEVALSGTNTYTGNTTVTSGTLTFRNTGARPVTGNTTVAAAATLGLGVGAGPTFFTSADVDSLFAGNLTQVINNATSLVGIDTTAGNFTYGTTLATNTKGMVKLGANTLTIPGTLAYTGVTRIDRGTLQIGDGVTDGVISTTANVTNSGTLAFNVVGSQSFNKVILGTGALSKLGAGTLSINATNTFSGGTTVSAGTLVVAAVASLGTGGVINNATLNLTAGTAADITYTGLSTALGGNGTTNVALGTAASNLTGNYSAYTGIWNISGAGGKAVMNGMDNAAATINVLANATIYSNSPTFVHNASVVLNGGDTGEAYGQLRLDGVTWNGAVTLAGAITGAGDGFVGSLSGTTGTISGAIGETGGSRSLSKVGAGGITLTGGNTFTGATAINAGTISISGANGTIKTSAGVTIAFGTTLNLENTTAANNGDRLGDSAAITMNGGTLNFSNDAGAADFTELAGNLTITSGMNTVTTSQAGASNNASLTFATLTRTDGSVNFTGSGLGLNSRNRILFTTAPTLINGIIGGWASYNGTGFASYDPTNGITAYTGYTDIDALGSTIADGPTTNVRINAAGTGGNIALGANPTNVNTLFQNTTTAAIVETAGNTLATSTVMIGSGMSALTIGAAPGDGTLMAAAPGGSLSLFNYSPSALTINAVIADNTSASSLATSGNVTLNGANTFSGPVNIGAGNLTLGSNSDQTLAGILSGTGTLVKSGTGNLTLSGNNTYSGGTVLNDGTLLVGSATALGASTGSLTFAGNATLATTANFTSTQRFVLGTGGTGTVSTDTATALSLNGVVSGAGALTKTGTGNLILNGVNTYTGATLISAGTLTAGNNASLGTTANGTTVASGATLDIGGQNLTTEVITIAGSGVDGTGAIVNTGAEQINALGRIVLAADATIGGSGARWDLRNSTPTLNLGNFTLTKNGTSYVALVAAAVSNPGHIVINEGELNLSTTTNLVGSLNNTLTVNSGAKLGMYDSTSAHAWTLNLNGGSIFRSGHTANATTQNIWAGPVNVSGDAALLAEATFTVSGNISGTGSFTKNGTATTTLSGNNTFSGGLTILSGILQVGNSGTSGSLGLGPITNNATLVFKRSDTVTQGTEFGSLITGTGTLTQSGNGTLILNGANTYTGVTGITAGTLKLANDLAIQNSPFNTSITGNGTLDLTAVNSPIFGGLTGSGNLTLPANVTGLTLNPGTDISLTYSGILSGNATLTKTGEGIQILSGANTYSGNTTIIAGTLTYMNVAARSSAPGTVTSVAAGATLGLGVGGNATYYSSTDVDDLFAGNLTWAAMDPVANVGIDTTAGNFTYSTTQAGGHGLNKLGANALLLTGNNSYTGGTFLTAGTVQIGVDPVGTVGAITSSAIGSGLLTFNGGAITSDGLTARTVLNPVVFAGNGVVGSLTNTGNLTFLAAADLGNATRTLTVNSEARFDGILSNGGLTKAGAGNLTLAGNNTYSGNTTLSTGILQVATDSVGAVGAITSSAVGTGNLTFAGGTLASDGLASRTIFNPVTFAGNGGLGSETNNGSLTLAANADLGNATRTLTVNSAARIDGVVSNGGLTKAGNGTLTLTAANSYNGTTAVTGGSLVLTGANATISASSAVTLGVGGTLKLDNTAAANNPDRIGDNATITMTGGTLDFANDGGAADFSESLGNLTITSGTTNTVSAAQAAATNNSTLTFASLNYVAGSVNFTGTGLGVDTRNRILFTINPVLVDGKIGAWATYNGLGYATYDPVLGVTEFINYTDIDARGSTITSNATASYRINAPGTVGNIELSDPTTVVDTLFQNTTTAATVNTANKTFVTKGLLVGAGKESLTIGAALNDGFLTAATANGSLVLTNDSSNALAINAVIANNGGASALSTKGNVTLNAVNTYTGNTTIGVGSLILASNSDYSPTTIFSGAGTLVKTGGGNLTLPVNNTHSGGTTISSGLVIAAKAGALGSGTVVNNATLNLTEVGTSITYTGLSKSLSGNGVINVSLSTGQNTTLLNGNYSGFTGTWNIGVGAVAGAGKVQLNGADNAAATVNMLTNSAVYTTGAITHNATIVLNGGDTGESLGQLRLDTGATWAGPVTLNGTITGTDDGFVGSYSGPAYISGSISETGGARQLSKAGGATIVLVGNNTYTGGTRVVGGTLQVGNGGTTGNLGFGPITNNATLVFNRSDIFTQGTDFDSLISGTGTLTQGGVGTLVLNGNNTYTGTTRVTAGTLKIASDLAIQNSAFDTASAGILDLSSVTTPTFGGLTGSGNFLIPANVTNLSLNPGNGTTITYSGTLGGNATITKIGLGTHVLTGNNTTFAGNTAVAAGTLSIPTVPSLAGYATPGRVAVGANGTLSVNFGGTSDWTSSEIGALIANNGAGFVFGSRLALNTANGNATTGNVTYATDIPASNLGITKLGAPALTLAGNNTYAGGTTLTAGTLKIGVDSVGTAGNITSSAIGTGTLAFNGGNLSSDGNATRSIFNALAFAGNTTLGDATNNGTLTFAGAADLGTAVRTLTVASPVVLSGAIGNSGGITKAGASALTLSGNNSYTGLTSLTAGTLNLNHSSAIGGNGGLTVSVGTLDNTSGSALTLSNAGLFSITGGFTFGGSNALTFANTAFNNTGTGFTITMLGTAGLNLGNVANNFTLAATNILNIANANGTVTIGNLTLSSNATNRVLQFGNAAGTGRVAVTGVISNGGTSTASGIQIGQVGAGAETVTLSGQSTFSGNTTIISGSLLAGTSSTGSVGAITSGPLGTGSLVLNGGTLASDSAAARTILNPVVFGGNPTFGTAAGNGTLTFLADATLGNATRTLTVAAGTTRFDGTISNGGITKAGAGALTLAGNNTYAGLTSLTAGTLNLDSDQAIGGLGGLTITGGSLNNTSGGDHTLANAGPLAIGGSYTFGGTHTLTFLSTNITATGATITMAGTAGLNLGNVINTNTTAATNVLSVANAKGNVTIGNLALSSDATNRTVQFGNAATANGTVVINGTVTNGGNSTVGGLAVGGPGTLVLNGNNTYAGNTTVSGNGTLRIGADSFGMPGNITSSAVGKGNLHVNGGTLAAVGAAARTIFNAIFLDGNATLGDADGTGNLTASGNASLGNSTRTISVASGSTARFEGVVSESGASGINKDGFGTLILSNANTFTGITRVSAGNLSLTNERAIQSSAYDPSGAGVLDLATVNTPVFGGLTGGGNYTLPANVTSLRLNPAAGMTHTYSGVLSGAPGFSLIKIGAGTQALAGANAHTGGTQVSEGALSYRNVTAKTGTTTVAPGATLALGVLGGDSSFFQASDVDALFANTLPGVTMNATSNAGIDTTAGSFTYAGPVPATMIGLNKIGANALTLTGANTYSGPTILTEGSVLIGVDSVGAPGAVTSGALGTGTLTFNGGTLASDGATPRTILNNMAFTANGAVGDEINSGLLTFSGNTDLGAATRTLTVNSPARFDGVIANGGLTKAGGAALVLAGANTYAGGTTLTAGGPLQLAADATGSVGAITSGPLGTGAVTFSGGALTSDSAAARTILNPVVFAGDGTIGDATNNGALTFAAGMDLGTATRSLAVNSAARIDGVIANGGLTKTGPGTLALAAANTFAGPAAVSQGTLALTGAAGSINAASAVAVGNGATLKLDNSAAANNGDRLGNNATVTMSGGTLDFANDAGAANFSESAGNLTISAGANTVSASQAGASNTSALTFAALTRTGGSVNFTGTGLGADTRNQILFTSAPTLTNGIIGGWAVYNGSGFATYNATTGITGYDGYTDIAATGSTIADGATTNVRINSPGSGGNIALGANATTVNTLFQNTTTAATVDTAGKSIATSTVMVGSGMAAVTLGANVGDGSIMPATANGTLSLFNYSASPLTVNAAVANNVSTSSLATFGNVVLNGVNTYNGTTSIGEGSLTLATNSDQTIAGVISGTGSLVKAGSGNLTLTATNSFTGRTSITGGKVAIATDAQLGTAPTTPTAGMIVLNNDAKLAVSGSGTTINANRGMTLAGNGVLEATGTNNLTYRGAVTGTGTLTLSMGGTGNEGQFGNAASNYSGGTILAAGSKVVVFDNSTGSASTGNLTAGAFGTGTITMSDASIRSTSGGAVRVGNAISLNGTLTVNAPSTGFTAQNLTFDGPATLAGNSGFINNSTALLTMSGTIGDSGAAFGITKAGTGSLLLTGANTFSGNATLAAGTLLVGAPSTGSVGAISSGPLGTGSLVLNGGTLASDSAAARTFLNPVVFGGNPTFGTAVGNGTLTFSAPASLGGATRTLTVAAGATAQFDGVISETAAAGITKAGNGTLVLTNAGNSYTGNVAVNAGTLRIASAGALGAVTKTITITAGNGVNPVLELDGTAGNILLPATTSFNTSGAAGVIRNIAGDNTIAGSFSLTSGNGNTKIISDGGSLSLTGNFATVAGAGNVRTLVLAGTSTGANTLSGVVSNGPWTMSFDKQGAGTWTLAGANTYTGSTSVSQGTLKLAGGSDRLPVTTVLTLGSNTTSGVLDLNGQSQTVAGLANGQTAAGTFLNEIKSASPADFTVNTSVASTYSGVLTGSLGLVKGGTSTLTLAGANTHTGPTLVNAGTLLIAGSTAGESAVTVAAGAMLGGNGTIGGNVTIGSAGRLMAGIDGTDSTTLTLSGGLAMLADSIIELGLASGATTHDILARTGAGDWTFQANQAFNFLDQGFVEGMTYTGIITGLAVDPGVAGWTVANAGITGTFAYNAGNIDFTLVAIPEPQTVVLIALALGAALFRLGIRIRRID